MGTLNLDKGNIVAFNCREGEAIDGISHTMPAMIPAYITLHKKKELRRRIAALQEILERCRLCPRSCRVNRLAGEQGYCRAGAGD